MNLKIFCKYISYIFYKQKKYNCKYDFKIKLIIYIIVDFLLIKKNTIF